MSRIRNQNVHCDADATENKLRGNIRDLRDSGDEMQPEVDRPAKDLPVSLRFHVLRACHRLEL
jgi:hypothetical protein